MPQDSRAASFTPWRFHNPVEVLFGAGCRRGLVQRLTTPSLKGRLPRLLAVTSKRGRLQLEEDALLQPLLPQLSWVDSVTPNPGLTELQHEIDRLQGQTFDAVLAFGGGSAMDAAKALTAALSPAVAAAPSVPVGADLAQLIAQPETLQHRALWPLYAIATTFGTGAEVTPFATIWDHHNRRKLSLASPSLYAKTAVIDPELSYSLPREATLATSLDALNQAFESVWNRNRSPLTLALAAQAIPLALTAIPRLMSDLADAETRAMMAEASLLAGLAISQTRTAICHAMSYPLTAHFGLSHGLACAATMAAAAHKVAASAPDCLEAVAVQTRYRDAASLVQALEAMLDEIGLRQIIAARLPATEAVLALREQMTTPGRSDNFVLPVTEGLMGEILTASLS